MIDKDKIAELEHTIKSLQLKLNTNGCDSVTDYMRYLKERNKVKKLKKKNAELKEKIKGFENGNVAWQGDMDATIKQNLELKEQIEKMKCCKMTESQMHKLASTPITIDCFEMDDFIQRDKSFETDNIYYIWRELVIHLEKIRETYNETKDKRYLKELIRLLPNSYQWELAE